MIKSITVTNHLGDSITLELVRPAKTGFIVKSITGLEPPKASINTASTATGEGAIYNSSRVSERNIVIDLTFTESELFESIEEIRHKSYKYFPIKHKVTLKVETDKRTSEIVGYVESNEINIFGKEQGSQISIICPYPYFKSSKDEVTLFHGIEGGLEFPFENESVSEDMIELGIIQNKTENFVYYNGDAETGIIMEIHAIGEVHNIEIYNLETREFFSIDTDKLNTMTGSGMINGDTIIVNTIPGEKSMTLLRNGMETNILNCMVSGSNWFKISKGTNVFGYTCAYGSTNLQFAIKNKILYEGV